MRADALIAQRSLPDGFILGPLRMRGRAVMAVMDPSKLLRRRLLGSILGFGLVMSGLMLGIERAWRGSAPPPLRIVMNMLQYEFGSLSMRWRVVQELERRQLDPDTTRAVAERLPKEASATDRSSLPDRSFIGKALAAGARPPRSNWSRSPGPRRRTLLRACPSPPRKRVLPIHPFEARDLGRDRGPLRDEGDRGMTPAGRGGRAPVTRACGSSSAACCPA